MQTEGFSSFEEFPHSDLTGSTKENSDDVSKETEGEPTIDAEIGFKALEETYQELDDALEPLRNEIDDLSNKDQEAVFEFCLNLVTGDEYPNEMAPSTESISQRLRGFMNGFRELVRQKITFESAQTRNKREECKTLIQDLSSRINYDAVFEYYGKGKAGASDSNSEEVWYLESTVGQLLNMRQWQFDEVVPRNEPRLFFVYDTRYEMLSSYAKEWEQKGFLDSNYRNDANLSSVYGEKVTTERRRILEELNVINKQLDVYNTMSIPYKPKVVWGTPFDPTLESILRCLNVEENQFTYPDSKRFLTVDHDPVFIEAAARYVSKLVDEHRKMGHLPESEETREFERQRIEAIDYDKVLGEIQFTGFIPPEKMIPVFTPEEITSVAKLLLPPDFVSGLKEISIESPKDYDESGSTYTVTGNYVPIFEDESLVASKIVIRRDLFLPEDASEEQLLLARGDFMGTLWHEYGHLAHQMMRYDEINSWEDALRNDNTSVTWYAEHSKNKALTAKMEDFAESFRILMTRPAFLLATSPERYKFLFGYVNSKLQSSQKERFNGYLLGIMEHEQSLWKDAGLSNEDIRDMYGYD